MKKDTSFFSLLEKEIKDFIENFFQTLDLILTRLTKRFRYSKPFFYISLLVYIIALGISIYRSNENVIILNILLLIFVMILYKYFLFRGTRFLATANNSDGTISNSTENSSFINLLLYGFCLFILTIHSLFSGLTSSSAGVFITDKTLQKKVGALRGKIKCGMIVFSIFVFFLHQNFYSDFPGFPSILLFVLFVLEPFLSILIFVSALLYFWVPLTGLILIGFFLHLWRQNNLEMLEPTLNAKDRFPSALTEESGFKEFFESQKDDILNKLLVERFPVATYDIFENSCMLMSEIFADNAYQQLLPIKQFLHEKRIDDHTIIEYAGILLRNYFLERFPKMKYARGFIKTKQMFVPKSYLK